MEMYHLLRHYDTDTEDLLKTVYIEKRITPKKYIENLTHVQCGAMESGVYHCRVTKNPTTTQKSLMAEVMNATSFCSTKWIGHCRTQAEKKLEEIRLDEDEDVIDTIVKHIMKRMHTRNHVHNNRLVCVCVITVTGGCMKSFPSRIGLARFLYNEYGEQ